MRGARSLVPAAAVLAVLAAVEVRLHGGQGVPAGAAGYLADCRSAAAEIPYALPGGWIGQDAPVPTQATDLLRPNVLVSRTFRRLGDRAAVGFLLVQTTHRRDLLHHHPPVCYPNQGWTVRSAEPARWRVDDLDIEGIVYSMTPPGRDEGDEPVRIYNFMLQANGSTGAGMDALYAGARRGAGDHFGPGQVQVLFFGGLDAASREATFASIIRAARPALSEILRPVEETP